VVAQPVCAGGGDGGMEQVGPKLRGAPPCGEPTAAVAVRLPVLSRAGEGAGALPAAGPPLWGQSGLQRQGRSVLAKTAV